MKLIKYDTRMNDPWADLETLFDRSFPLFNQFFSPEYATARQLPVNLYETEASRYAEFEIPGVSREDLNVELENAVLTIKATRRVKRNGEDTSVEFSRSVTVGDDIKAESVTAKLEDGILKVEMPKQEEAQPKQISVN